MGGLDSWDGSRCRCGKSESREVAIDPSRPVQVSAQGLKANPDFAGLTGTVTHVREDSLSVFFPERGASSVWLTSEIENAPPPSPNPQRRRTNST
jgi:hypothetical protein